MVTAEAGQPSIFRVSANIFGGDVVVIAPVRFNEQAARGVSPTGRAVTKLPEHPLAQPWHGSWVTVLVLGLEVR